MNRPKNCKQKIQRMKVKFVINKVTRMINHSVTNCLSQSNVEILRNYTRSI
jgi:hypothetical protein